MKIKPAIIILSIIAAAAAAPATGCVQNIAAKNGGVPAAEDSYPSAENTADTPSPSETDSPVADTTAKAAETSSAPAETGTIPATTQEPATEAKLEDEGKELSPMELMQSILLGRHSFVYTGKIDDPDNNSLTAGTVTNLREYFNSFIYDPDKKYSYFVIADLDGDSINEIVLYRAPGAADIFHYENGSVYLSGKPYRGIKNIKTDGTHFGSSGSTSTYVHSGHFVNGVFEDVLIGNCDFDMATGEDFCYIGAERVTHEEWVEWYHELESLPSCEEYSFTEENIREYIR